MGLMGPRTRPQRHANQWSFWVAVLTFLLCVGLHIDFRTHSGTHLGIHFGVNLGVHFGVHFDVSTRGTFAGSQNAHGSVGGARLRSSSFGCFCGWRSS